MKVFNLRCAQDHSFEGWFASADDFDDQQARQLISCPICNTTEVVKAPSAPYIGTGASEPSTAVSVRQPAAMPTSAQLQAMFVKMAREIAANTEDVGERFAEEARRIHYDEAPERGIRGLASKDEAQALEEEGISVMPLPFGHLLKDPLQ
ncbi:MAG: DUF1178 family protein [Burkholderiaceae bacterium]|nr:DUF1178 family protein [Burkholderiaceae bacterium]